MILKRLIFSLIFIFISTNIQAQLIKIDSETGEFKYEEVIQADGQTKDKLLEKSETWISQYYKDALIKNDTAFSANATVPFSFTWKFISKPIPVTLIYDVEIKVKDNRYKYAFTNLRIGKVYKDEIDAISLKTYMERFPQKYLLALEEPIDAELTKAITSLENYIITGKMNQTEEEW
ncbi:MAG: DUF4468 domain-containing protein [Lutimonas sp.]